MKKNLCTIDRRVKDQYIYEPERQQDVLIGLAQVMREMHEYRVSRGHAPSQQNKRPIHAYEFKVYHS